MELDFTSFVKPSLSSKRYQVEFGNEQTGLSRDKYPSFECEEFLFLGYSKNFDYYPCIDGSKIRLARYQAQLGSVR